MSNNSAYDILMKIINKRKEQPFIGATTVDTYTEVNDGGVRTRFKTGGKWKHPLYKKYRGLVVSIKNNKNKTKKKRSPKNILKKVRKEIKKRNRKGTRKQNKELQAWKLHEKTIGGRKKKRKRRCTKKKRRRRH